MTRDDVIRMAREAGFWVNDDGSFNGGDDAEFGLLNFAALVAAAEREACAKVCDELHATEETFYRWVPDGRAALIEAADAIRARGNDDSPTTS